MNRDEAIEALKAISIVEGYVIGIVGLKRPSELYKNIDFIADLLVREINKTEDIEEGMKQSNGGS
jgi:hypothetical protein